MPGNTRAENPVYNYAWLDTVILRDDSAKINACELIPVDEYPYSMTADEFVSETEEYKKLFDLNVDNVSEAFFTLLDSIYYTLVALGMDEPDYDTVYNYLSDYGINLTYSNSDFTAVYAQILYSFLKDNSFYALYGKTVELPKGITLEHAMVIYLAEALGIALPSGIDTVTGLTLLVMRSALPEGELPISDNPTDDEGFYWAKVAVSAKNGYEVPTAAFNEISDVQSDYVDYAYFASLLALKYDVKLNPVKLCAAMTGGEEYAVEYLILKTMLDQKGAVYDDKATLEQLFDLACQNGWFALENEFYSDIYEYNVTIPYECERVWFTPFSLCGQLEGGKNEFFTVKLDGQSSASGTTQFVQLKTRRQTVKIECSYNDGVEHDTAVYTFNIRKAAKQEPAAVTENGGVLGSIESAIMSALPEDSVDAAARVSEAFGIVGSAVSDITNVPVITTYTVTTQNDTTSAATTGSVNETTEESSVTGATEESTGMVFTTYSDSEKPEYSSESVFTTYPEETQNGIFSKAAAAINNNPVAVATPVSAAALGAALGLVFYRKRRNSADDFTVSDEDGTASKQ
ncbi:MAG: cadherin-like beta sandwich domain-containing protein [Clostridia bacterium]|nr:cadherin-like beta sandwich domain-containing protein [Clostridia bacterium]